MSKINIMGFIRRALRRNMNCKNSLILIGNSFDDTIEASFPGATIEQVRLDHSNNQLHSYLYDLASLAGFANEDDYDYMTIINGYIPSQLEDYPYQLKNLTPVELTSEKIDVIGCLSAIVNTWWDLQVARDTSGIPDFLDNAISNQIRFELFYIKNH